MSAINCKYVGSRGLLLSCDRKSPIPIPDFDGLNPDLYSNIQEDNSILHVCPQALGNFVRKVLPTLTRPFILITNNSDWTIPDDVRYEFARLINHPLLTHWFAQNCVIDHPSLTRIPIGLDYHTLAPTRKQVFAWSQPERHSWGIKVDPTIQEQSLLQFQLMSKPFWERQVKAYANFQFLMTTRYGKIDRTDCLNTVSKDLVYYEPTKCIRAICWDNMIKHAFVLSPQGNGLDCHRTWEALCLGCIPIVKTSGLDPLFEGLPVWIVSSWSEVTRENMVSKINEFKERTFQTERLTLDFWRKRIFGFRTGN
jgi:hypothetical protein